VSQQADVTAGHTPPLPLDTAASGQLRRAHVTGAGPSGPALSSSGWPGQGRAWAGLGAPLLLSQALAAAIQRTCKAQVGCVTDAGVTPLPGCAHANSRLNRLYPSVGPFTQVFQACARWLSRAWRLGCLLPPSRAVVAGGLGRVIALPECTGAANSCISHHCLPLKWRSLPSHMDSCWQVAAYYIGYGTYLTISCVYYDNCTSKHTV
jgi:hypothetical protein